MNQTVSGVPQVPQVPEKQTIRVQTQEVTDWDDKAYGLMLEPMRPLPKGTTNPFDTLTLDSAEILMHLLTKPLKLVTPKGIVCSDPLIQDRPDLAPLAQWLREATTSLKKRRAGVTR